MFWSRQIRWAFFAILLATAGGYAFAAERAELLSARQAIRSDALQGHINHLADDTFEGREAGKRGGRAAGVYLERQLREAGLQGGTADGSFFQDFGAGYRNILGLLPGSDPQLKDQVILVCAHYDHVGYGNQQNSYGPWGYIHNGADDNASGTAGLLELAKVFGTRGLRPARSILFCFWDGEEKGLLGSEHWVANPTFPLSQVAVVINMDMIGRLGSEPMELTGTRTSWGLRQLVSRQNAALNVPLDFSWEIVDNSDHYPFYRNGIPFLLLHTGLHADYHRPSDDADKIDSQGMQQIIRLLVGVVDELANMPEKPRFRSAVRQETLADQRTFETPLAPLPPRLGLSWLPPSDQSSAQGTASSEQGVRVSDVTLGGPASRAGVSPGDLVVALAGGTVVDGESLRKLVMQAPPETTITVVRETEAAPLELPIKLEGPPVRWGVTWRGDDADPAAVLVTRVIPGTPIAAAQVQTGDRIYEVAGQRMKKPAEFVSLLSSQSAPFELLIERDGIIKLLKVIPAPDLVSASAASAP